MQAAYRKPRRTANACIACRQSKIKCSGDEPCANCQRRFIRCQFSEASTKVLVSERYLRDLQKQARQWRHSSGIKRSRGSVLGPEDEIEQGTTIADAQVPSELEPPASQMADSTFSIWTSPFTLPSTVIKDTRTNKRNWIWLAPTSAWSFTARLTVMMTEKLNLNPDYSTPGFYLDGDIYPFEWNRFTTCEPPDVSDLPSIDYALYLFNTVKFHLGQTYRFFDDASFTSHIYDFYSGREAQKAVESRIWFVQFLLVLAFGKAFLSRPKNHNEPPGSRFFVRAMAAMPNHTSTGRDSLMVIEALALAGLYLYAIDHREGAHVNVGQAIRIAQLEGMHTQLPEEELGAATVARCRNLWWTLYIMDRHVSSSLGLPMTTQDGDITTLSNPPTTSLNDTTFSLQVRLSQMLSFILATIYRTEKTQLGAFLEITRNILQTMAGLAEEIEKMFPVDFQGTMDSVPHETRYLILLYHQCVIVATRPLLLSVLKERLEKLGRAEEDWQKFLALPKSLISIGIKSAVKTLQILSDENIFLEVFLPFDLEFTYAASLHLTMAHTLFPPDAEDQKYSQVGHSILDEFISSGNRVAEIRKAELNRLEGLFQELAARVEQEGLQTLTLAGPAEAEMGLVNGRFEDRQGQLSAEEPEMTSRSPSAAGNVRSLPSAELQMPSNVDSLDNIGISSYEFLSIVDQIGNPDLSHGLLDSESEWLEGGNMPGPFG